MPRPGTDVYILDGGAPGGPSFDTGQALFAGVAERGPAGVSTSRSLADFKAQHGVRSGGSLLYDAAAAFFGEGGNTLLVSRIIGAGAATATAAFGTATAKAANPGTWGNSIVITPTGSPVVLVVTQSGVEVERSPVVTNIDDCVTWSAFSNYVRITKGADNLLPTTGTPVTLATGTAGTAPTTAELTTALARFDIAYGPGQVCAPGMSTTVSHQELLKHCDATKRVALLDLPDTSDPTAMSAAVQALYSTKGCRMAAAFGPWVTYPAETSPATVVAPYSGMQAGMIARADALGNPNQPAAGINGVSRLALGLSQVYTDAQRETANRAGVTFGKPVQGGVRTYGGRTVAGPSDVNWLWFGNSRVVMAIAFEASNIAENYVLRQIDGRRQLFAALEADLVGMLTGYWQAGALYGETPGEAFYVDTSEAVNTVATIAAGEVHAAVYVKTSPSAEYVRVDIVKVPIDRALPNAA